MVAHSWRVHGPSWRERNNGRAGDDWSHGSHGQEEETDAGIELALSFLFNPGPQFRE